MDRREDILQRIVFVCEAAGFATQRMDPEMRSGERPSVFIDDGMETLVNDGAITRPVSRPSIMKLFPKLYVLCTGNTAPASLINQHRATLIKAMSSDAPLSALCQPVAALRYVGCEPQVRMAEAFAADVILNFELHYVLNPTEL
jgi:hypothetical protein